MSGRLKASIGQVAAACLITEHSGCCMQSVANFVLLNELHKLISTTLEVLVVHVHYSFFD